jgi:hypothetical protein
MPSRLNHHLRGQTRRHPWPDQLIRSGCCLPRSGLRDVSLREWPLPVLNLRATLARLSASVKSGRNGREKSAFAELRRKKPNVNKSGRNALQKKALLLALQLLRSLFRKSPRHLHRARAERIA